MNKNEVLRFLNSQATAAPIKAGGLLQRSDSLAPTGERLGRGGAERYALKPPMSARSAFL